MEEDEPERTRWRRWAALCALCLVLTALHAMLTWGHVGLFWGDAGVWRDMVARVGAGEVAYRDFYVHVPPLAIWGLGTFAGSFGADVSALAVATTGVALVLALAFAAWVGQLLDGPLALISAAAALTLALATSSLSGAPLATGMYNPAVPVGAACLVLALASSLLAARRGGILPGLSTGLLVALCVAAKQDFWAPALVAAAAVGWCRWRVGDRAAVLALAAGVFIPLVTLVSILVAQLGALGPLDVATGFGMAGSSGLDRAVPSWHRLVVRTFTTSLVAGSFTALLVLFGVARARRLWLVAGFALAAVAAAALYTWVVMDTAAQLRVTGLPVPPTPTQSSLLPWLRSDASPVQVAATLLREDAIRHLLPPALLLIAFAVLAAGPSAPTTRRFAAILVMIAFSAHARRGFEAVDWFQYLIEVPVLVWLLVQRFGRAAVAPTAVALGLLIALAGWIHWDAGAGALTRSGGFDAIESARGPVRLPSGEATDLRQLQSLLDELDPERARPLVAHGHNGGFGYFLGRRNPTPLTLGFSFSDRNPQALVDSIRGAAVPVFVLDNRSYDRMAAASGSIDWRAWDNPVRPNRFARAERPLLAQLVEGCARVRDARVARLFALYDCAVLAR